MRAIGTRIMLGPRTPRWHWHRWRTITDNGMTTCQDCRCGGRRVLQRAGGAQPIPWNWLGAAVVTRPDLER